MKKKYEPIPLFLLLDFFFVGNKQKPENLETTKKDTRHIISCHNVLNRTQVFQHLPTYKN